MPQIKMPDGVVVNFPDDMPSGEIKQYINQSLEKVNMSKGNEFTRGVARGIDTTKSLAVEGGGWQIKCWQWVSE